MVAYGHVADHELMPQWLHSNQNAINFRAVAARLWP
jgi:hypothetical protein